MAFALADDVMPHRHGTRDETQAKSNREDGGDVLSGYSGRIGILFYFFIQWGMLIYAVLLLFLLLGLFEMWENEGV